MRELILTMSMSLDGFVANTDGEAKWIFSGDEAAIAWKVDNVSNASLHIMGSRVFHGMAAFWPTATTAFAPPMNQIPKAVFSRQGPSVLAAATAALENAQSQDSNTETAQLQPGAQSWAQAHVINGELPQAIAALKAADGKPIVVHGGATFARNLIAHNLVDEYRLLVYPIVLGKGLPIFTDLPSPRPLALVGSKAFPSGAVAQVYRPA